MWYILLYVYESWAGRRRPQREDDVLNLFLWVVLVALGLVLFGFTVYAFAEGGLGLLSGARFERCPRCGRHGLVVRGQLHPRGCPHPSYRQRLRHSWETWSAGLHIGHH